MMEKFVVCAAAVACIGAAVACDVEEVDAGPTDTVVVRLAPQALPAELAAELPAGGLLGGIEFANGGGGENADAFVDHITEIAHADYARGSASTLTMDLEIATAAEVLTLPVSIDHADELSCLVQDVLAEADADGLSTAWVAHGAQETTDVCTIAPATSATDALTADSDPIASDCSACLSGCARNYNYCDPEGACAHLAGRPGYNNCLGTAVIACELIYLGCIDWCLIGNCWI